MPATLMLLLTLLPPVAADGAAAPRAPLETARPDAVGVLTDPGQDPTPLAGGPPSGAAVTFDVDWRLTSQPAVAFGLAFDFIQEMHIDVTEFQGLEASRSTWQWSAIDFQRELVDDGSGSLVEMISSPAVSAGAWEFADPGAAERLYEIGQENLWSVQLIQTPFAFLNLLFSLESFGVMPLAASQQLFPNGELGTAVRAAGGELAGQVDQPAGLTAAGTTLTLDDNSSVSPGDLLRLDGEIVEVATVDPNGVDVGLLRAREGTSAAAHADGARVYAVEPQTEWPGTSLTATREDVDAQAGVVPLALGLALSDGDVIRLGDEAMVVSCAASPCGDEVTVTRGARGTVAADHLAGTPVKRFLPVEDLTLDRLTEHNLQRGAGSIDFSVTVDVRRSFDLRRFKLLFQNIVMDYLGAGHVPDGEEIPAALDQSVDIEYRPESAEENRWVYRSRLWFDSEATFDATVALFNDEEAFSPILLQQFLVQAPEWNGADLLQYTATCRPDPSWANQEKQCIDGVSTAPDLSIAMTASSGLAVPGVSLSYTVVASNDGPANAAVQVEDTFPEGLSCSWISTAAGGATGHTDGSGDLAETLDMPSLSSVTYAVDCAIDPGLTGSLSNTASVTSAAEDTDPTDNSATITTPVVPKADVGIAASGPTIAVPGGAATYAVTVTNDGPSTAEASVVNAFGAGLGCSWTSTSSGDAGGSAGLGVGDIDEALVLPPRSSIVYTAECAVDPSAVGSVSSAAEVTSRFDASPGNNVAAAVTVLTPAADLSVTKTDGVAEVAPGGSTTYTIRVSNAGPSAAPADVADVFSTDLACVWASASAGGALGSAGAGAGDIAESLTLPPGGSIVYTAECDIDPAATGLLSNTATVSSDVETSPADNTATDTSRVATIPGFSQDFEPDSISPGEISTLTFTVDNSPNALAVSGLAFTGAFPAGLRPADTPNLVSTCVGGTVEASQPGGSSSDGSSSEGSSLLSFSGGTVPGREICSVGVDVTALTGGAYISVPSPLSTDIGEGAAAAATLVVLAPPVLTQAYGPELIAVGESATLTFTIDNTGSSLAADGLAFSAPLPASLEIEPVPAAATDCAGGQVTAVGGLLTLVGGSVDGGATCTVRAEVTASTPGVFANTTGPLSSSAGPGEATGGQLTVVPTLSISGVSGSEADGVFHFSVTRSHGGTPVSVTATTKPGTATADVDFISSTGVLNFGADETLSLVFPVSLVDDVVVEPTEIFTVELADVTGAMPSDSAVGVGSIEPDGDAAVLSLRAVQRREAGGPFELEVVLDQPVDGAVSVDLSTFDITAEDETGDGDYLSLAGHVVQLPPLVTRRVVNVGVQDDSTLEALETFGTTFSNLQAGGLNVSLDPSPQVHGIENDDSVVLSIADVQRAEGAEGQLETVVLTVDLEGESTVDIGFDFRTIEDSAEDEGGDGDFRRSEGSAVIAAGENAATLEVAVVGDDLEEGDEVFFVDLSNASPGGPVSISKGRAVVTLAGDDDFGPPTVIAVVDGGGDEIRSCGGVSTAVAALGFEFDQTMAGPGRGGEAGDVTDPASYLLVAAGDDGDFSTVSCAGGQAGDDVPIGVSRVDWDGAGRATLRLAEILGAGLFQLHACSGLSDLAGNGLDGDGSGGGAEDFIRRFRADPGNLFENGHFDDCGLSAATLAPWSVDVGSPSSVEPLGADAGGSPLSTSVRLEGLGSEPQLTLSQCAPAGGGATYDLSASVGAGPSGTGVEVRAFCAFYPDGACGAGSLGAQVRSLVLSGTDEDFRQHGTTAVAPSGAGSALCGVDFQALDGVQSFDAAVDRLVLRSDGGLIFADGFESGTTSLWSSTQ
ncbi:MAG: Calx-beta domain-containing protein [Acidobacteriota bacterium]